MTVVTHENENYPLKPGDIDASKHFWGSFGNYETETSAGYIVRYLQTVGSWQPFKKSALDAIHRKAGYMCNFAFNRLTTDGYVVKREDGLYCVTHEFITRCFLESPSYQFLK